MCFNTVTEMSVHVFEYIFLVPDVRIKNITDIHSQIVPQLNMYNMKSQFWKCI
jgi:hypothetical protein